jgi:hypothetical protein
MSQILESDSSGDAPAANTPERWRRKAGIRHAVVACTAIIALLALVGFGWALKARGDERANFLDATARRLAAESQLMLNGMQPGGGGDELGMQEALAAFELPSPDRGAKYPLVMALNQERDLLKVIATPAMVLSVAYSPDATRIAAGMDNTVRLWDAATGRSANRCAAMTTR